MGVNGLWKLIEPSGKVVPLDTLDGKVLAVDISIWLHQAIKGYRDSKGASIPNAHLLTIYNRVCKLLYFRIKPVFVFDGGVPTLKKETIAKRNQLKFKNQSDAVKIQKQLINTLLKHSAVSKVLSEKTRAELGSQARKITAPKKDTEDDLFVLPPSQTTYESSDSETCDETSGSDSSPSKYFNIHDVDEKSVRFRNLPADVRHEILTDLKETRKQNSWGRIHELPTQSDDFATYQMKRLLKRYSIQTCLEEAEREMGGATLSLNELESLLNDHGVITDNKGNRIASDENTRYLYIKDVKKTLESTKVKELKDRERKLQEEEEVAESDFQDDLETAVKLSFITEGTVSKASTSHTVKETEEDKLSQDSEHSEFESDLQAAIKLSLQTEEVQKSNKTRSKCPDSESRTHAEEFQKDLEAAIKLSLQETPSTSLQPFQEAVISSDEVSSSDVTPISSQGILNPEGELSTYLQTLRDSDFNSSDEESKLDESLEEGQSAADKIFSTARNYMIEYGGLTQAGVAEIFGQKDESAKMKANVKGKSVWFNPRSQFYEEKVVSNVGANRNSGEENDGLIAQSDSSSDGEFVEVISEDEHKTTSVKQVSKSNNGDTVELHIEFNCNDELVDDIFDDIFDSKTPEASLENNLNIAFEVRNDAKLVSPQKSNLKEIDLSVSQGTETETTTEESKHTQKSTMLQEPPSTSTLLQEIIADKSFLSTNNVSVEEMMQLKRTLNEASLDLMVDRASKERLGANISDQMCCEAQHLLSLFGIPYIIAPMEAEAQCAFLNEINLTDGTITDDSDIWLFGGKTVYKNFFNHDKRVLEFKSESIQHHFKLSRHQLISLAMLVGSDYTTGVQGIGPVTALEVLAAFPPQSAYEIIASLERFRDWFKTGRKAHGRGKAFLRNKLRNIELHDGFPSSSVPKAYLEPTVETSKDTFSWGKPRVDALISYTRDKFGWSAKKVTDTLDPVLRRLSDNTAQKRIQDYFKTVHKAPLNTSVEIQQKLSKRVQKALGTMGAKIDTEGNSSCDDFDDMAGVNDLEDFEAIQVLKQTKKLSKQKTKTIQKEVEIQLRQIDRNSLATKFVKDEPEVKKPRLVNLRRKEVILQKEIARTNQLQNRLKAIEAFRKSNKGPGFVKKRVKIIKKLTEDGALSESSDSN